MKKLYKNNNFIKWGSTCNEKFELPDELYSLSDIQDHFEYSLTKYREKTVNLSIRIYINKIEHRTTFKIKNQDIMSNS